MKLQRYGNWISFYCGNFISLRGSLLTFPNLAGLFPSLPNPAGQFLDVPNPTGQFLDVPNPTGQFLDVPNPAVRFLDVSSFKTLISRKLSVSVKILVNPIFSKFNCISGPRKLLL